MDTEMVSKTTEDSRTKKTAVTGVVTSISGDKTIRVQVNRLVKDPIYGKYLRRRTKLAVHDAKNEAEVGDTVAIVPCRPISKRKSWRLSEIVKKSVSVSSK